MHAASASKSKSNAKTGTTDSRGRSVPTPPKDVRSTRPAAAAATARATSSSGAGCGATATNATTAAGKVTASALTSRLEVSPPVGEFINYDVDTTYVLAFTIRNQTRNAQVLRFAAPQKPQTPFRIVDMRAAKVAPGLSHTIEVEFSTHVINDLEDSFTVLNSNGDRLVVPLVSRCMPALEFAEQIDFGRVEHTNVGASMSLTLVNRGRRAAMVSLTPSTTNFVVRPPHVTVPALGSATVSVELAALPPGAHTWPLTVAVEGESDAKPVRVLVDVVDGRSKLIDPKTQQEAVSVSFDRVYSGSHSTYALQVQNGSDHAASFAFQLTNELATLELPPFRFVPEQGRLGPKEVKKVLVEFAPPLTVARKGWSNPTNRYASAVPAEPRKFEGLFSLLFVETEQVHHFHVHGESVDTQAWVSEPVLDFGTCEMGDYRNRPTEIHNAIQDLPLQYAIDSVANFTIKPASGTVPRGGVRTVDVTFVPHVLGACSERVCVTFNGTDRQYLTLLGHSSPAKSKIPKTMLTSGHRLPEDFVRPHQPPNAPRPSEGPMAGTASFPATATATADASAPQIADIGMTPAEGLHPPQPSSRVPLRVLQDEDAATRNPAGGHVGPRQFDTRALIKRRFPEQPSNAMERRDCRRELMPMDLLKVVSPIRLVDFGNITVGASSTKSFYVFNGSSACVLVSMPVEEPGLRFEPASQVIPPNRMAQFDVRFRSASVQSCQQVVHYLVNHHHRMRFALHAVVIPVEVVVSQTEVRLNYAAATASDVPCCRAALTLANNGNSPATYVWELLGENAAHFAVQPSAGVLVPSSKLNVNVAFTAPPGAVATELECEARLTVEGAVQQKVVKLIGAVAPSRCAWTKRIFGLPQNLEAPNNSNGATNGGRDAKLGSSGAPADSSHASGTVEEMVVDLRRVPAGKPTSFTVELANRGGCNAFFSFEDLPETIQVTPERGRLCHGETEEITMTLRSDRAEVVDELLFCFVRGMRKPLRLQLSATVVAPPLSILYPVKNKGEVALDFGEVYAQSQAARLLRFKNTGDVDAVVHVQLSGHSNYFVRTPTRGDRLATPASELQPQSQDQGESRISRVADVRVELVGGGSSAGAAPTAVASAATAVNAPTTATTGADRETWSPTAEADTVDGRTLDSAGGCYLLTVPKATEADVSFVFAPTTVSHQERFYIRWRQVGADELHPLLPLVLSAASIAPRLRLSAAAVSFPTVVSGHSPAPHTLIVENVTTRTLRWHLEAVGESSIESSAATHFLIEPTNGELAAHGRQTVQLRYLARRTGLVDQMYHLVADEERSKPCRTLTVTAAARPPRVLCDHDCVRFPAVPLGVPVKTTVWLVNDGFDAIKVAYQGHSAPVLTVELPQGDVLSSTHTRIPVDLTFCSTQPLDLVSSIVFATNLGETVKLGITASANNSVFTTQPFLQYRDGQLGVVAADAEAETPAATGWRVSGAQPFVLADSAHYLRARSSVAARAALQHWSTQPCCGPVRFQPPAVAADSDKTTASAAHPPGAPSASSGTSSAAALPPKRDAFSMLDTVANALIVEGSRPAPSSPRHGTDLGHIATTTTATSRHPAGGPAILGTNGLLSVLHLTRWLNITVLASPVNNLLEALQHSHGSLLADIIEHWFGKRPRRTATSSTSAPQAPQAPGAGTVASSSLSKGEAALDVLLTFLRSFGACLSAVDTIYLLPYDEYATIAQARCESLSPFAMPTPLAPSSSTPPPDSAKTAAVVASGDAAQSSLSPAPVLTEPLFQRRAHQCWLAVVLESVRLFLLSKVTPANVVKLGARMDLYLTDVGQWTSKSFTDALNASNVYSAHESLLLHMIRGAVSAYRIKHDDANQTTSSPCAAANKALRQQQIRIDAFEDLRDARVLSLVVLNFVPDLHRFFYEGDRKLIANPSTLAEHESNAQLLLAALGELGLPPMCTERAFVELAVVDVVLLCTSVLWYLPKFIPTGTLRFEGRLLSTITQTVEVNNPSLTETRTYRVSVEDPLFALSATELVVAPKSTAALEISFCPRYMREVRGRCRVVEVSSGVRLADRRPLVVDLVVVPNKEPSKVIRVDAPLYESVHVDVPVVSPFATDCVVGLRLSQEYDATVVPEEGCQAQKGAAAGCYAEAAFVGQRYRSAFFVSADVLPLRRGETTRLPLQFIPLGRGRYTLRITFREEREGEFTYVVEGTCLAPKPSSDSPVEFRAELDEATTQTASIRPTNSSLERAVRLYEERSRQVRPTSTWADPQELQKSAPLRRPNASIAAMTTDGSAMQYQVLFVNDALEGPSPFFACESTDGICAMPDNGSPAPLQFRFNPKYVGRYTGFILLTSPVDVRLVRLVGECVPKGERYQLQFRCPARQSITQDIIIRNPSTTDWLFTASLAGSEAFHGARELRVPAGKTREYTLKYAPSWMTEQERSSGNSNNTTIAAANYSNNASAAADKATLILQNQINGQKHSYTLTGIADAPLCEESLHIECRARDQTSVTLSVPSVCQTDTTYIVETDMPFTVGDPHLVVPRGAVGKYTLKVSPTVGGTFDGRLIFRSPTGRYVWYTLELVAAPPEKEATLELLTDVRTTVVADVTLTNPLDKPLVFDVRRYGAGLHGPRMVELGPGESGVYSCTFTPVQVGTFEGRLSFCNEAVGEFWYALRMVVEDASPEELTFETALGTTLSAQVRLPNLTDRDYRLTVQNDNTANFAVQPTHVTLPAHSETLVELVYKPTCVDVVQVGRIALTHPQLGEWKYECRGTGTPPEAYAEQSCLCETGTSATITLPVTNTLDVDSAMEVSLEGEDSAACHFSISRSIEGELAAGASANIVLLYAPTTVGQSRITVVVRPTVGQSSASYRVAWRYPVTGCAEWRERSAKPFRFRSIARQQTEETVLLPAPGLTAADRESCHITFTPDARQHSVSAATSALSTTIVPDAVLPEAVQVRVRFAPLRPLTVSGEWTLHTATAGAWRYRVYLEASPAPVDDVITLQCAHGESAAVSFDVHNVFPFKSKFAAYFALGSSKDLRVSPSQGVLMPFVMGQRPGVAAATALCITFAPSVRVPQVEGLLVVDTEDMQWTFKVVGKMAANKGTRRP